MRSQGSGVRARGKGTDARGLEMKKALNQSVLFKKTMARRRNHIQL
jgi:hypothetical protein